MADREPSISVIMPVFNAARFVEAAIESVLSQSFGDFEFIIVDDGSTDRTSEILRRCADRDPRIRLIAQSNTGVVGALNRGLAEARAPLLARMDADDLCRSDRFEVQQTYLSHSNGCSVVGSAVRLIDAEGRGERVIHHPRRLENLRQAVSAGRILAHPTAMIRRDLLRRVGGYREVFQGVEDTDLWLRLVSEGPIANVEDVLLDYRMHSGKVTEGCAGLTRIKESVVRGLAFDRLSGRPESDLAGSSIVDLALDYATRSIDSETSNSNPWMDDRRTRRILRDILQVEPSRGDPCRRLLSRLATRQLRRLQLGEAAKTFFYRCRWDG